MAHSPNHMKMNLSEFIKSIATISLGLMSYFVFSHVPYLRTVSYTARYDQLRPSKMRSVFSANEPFACSSRK
jgi:hypothetical protein